jgi:hypothetical protein
MTYEFRVFFPNVTSLTLKGALKHKILSQKQLLEYLPMIVDLSNVQHLDIIDPSVKNVVLILLEVLKRAPRLSSITLLLTSLKSFFDNAELCMYLNKQMKRLNSYYYLFDSFNEVRQFCEVFSNIEQFRCTICDQNHLLYLLDHLPHLSFLEITVSASAIPERFLCWFKEFKVRSNLMLLIEELPSSLVDNRFGIWIERKIQ